MCGADVMAALTIPTGARARARTRTRARTRAPSLRRQRPTQRSIGRLLVVAIAVTDLKVALWAQVQAVSYPIVLN